MRRSEMPGGMGAGSSRPRAALICLLLAGVPWSAWSVGVEIAPGVECEPVEVPGWSRGSGSTRVERAVCDESAGAWRVRVRLDAAILRVLTGPFDGPAIQPSSPLDMIQALEVEASPRSHVAVVAVNGGFFGGDAETGRVFSFSSLGDGNRVLPSAVHPSRLSPEARCRVTRRGAFVLWCGPQSCRGAIEAEDLTQPSAPVGHLAARTDSGGAVAVARIGGGGRLLPDAQSVESVPDCAGGPGQPDPDWDRRRPRTAVGLIAPSVGAGPAEGSAADVVELFVSRAGLTLAELSTVARRLGWQQGLALDGGGSSQLWLRDGAGWARRGGSRPVASALVVYAPAAQP